jgi:TolB-like protein
MRLDVSPAIDSIELAGASVDFRREEVRDRYGVRTKLQPRLASVLRYLAANAGTAVAKDELLETCWPGVVVTEDSLTQCISDLRRVLGDNDRDLIRTTPRCGYMLVLPDPDWASIAVVAFDAFSGDAGDRLLGAGFAGDIIAELARNKVVKVIARNSSFAAHYQGKTAQDIAHMFHVRYVLEGSIRRVGERMFVNAQLIHGRDSRLVWAERYTLVAQDIFAAQDDLVARIAGTLFSEMRRTEEAASLRRPPATLDVY